MLKEELDNILAQMGGDPEAALAALISSFEGTVNKAKGESKTAYEEAIEAIEGYYASAAEGRGEEYASNFSALSDALANLDMSFEDGDLAREWDADMQAIQEASDVALANDLAWFEKMQSAQNDMYNAMLIEMAAQQAIGSAVGGSSGGGGGGGSGGGGGGGSDNDGPYDPMTGELLGDQDFTNTSESETRFYNPGWAIEINQGRNGESGIFSPEEAEFLAARMNDVGGGGPVEIRQVIQSQLNTLRGDGYYDIGTGQYVAGGGTSPRYERGSISDTQEGVFNMFAEQGGYISDQVLNNEKIAFLQGLLDKSEIFDPNFQAVNTQWKMDEVGKWKAYTIEGVPLADADPLVTEGIIQTELTPEEQAMEELTNSSAPSERTPSFADTPSGKQFGTANEAFRFAAQKQEADRLANLTPSERKYGSIHNAFKEAARLQEIEGYRDQFDEALATPEERRQGRLAIEAERRLANRGPNADLPLSNLPDHLATRATSGVMETRNPNAAEAAKILDKSTPKMMDMTNMDNSFQANEDGRFQRIREQQDAAQRRIAEKKAAEERARQAQAAARSRQAQSRSSSKASSGLGKSSPGATVATQSNPHPMGTGIFGQPVRTAVPFHIAAPKKKPRQPLDRGRLR